MQFKHKIRAFLKDFRGEIHKILTIIASFLKANDVEITMFIGLFFISFATYRVNLIAFLYLIGVIFIILSLFLLKYPKGRE